MSNKSNLRPMLPSIFNQLLSFSKFACVPPTFERVETRYETFPIILFRELTNSFSVSRPMKSNRTQSHSTVEWVSMNYIPFGEKALSVAVKLYQRTASEDTVIEGHILHEIIRALSLPLSLKYKCMSASTWKLAITSLLSVLHTGLQVARSNPNGFSGMWLDLSETIDKFLFPSR